MRNEDLPGGHQLTYSGMAQNGRVTMLPDNPGLLNLPIKHMFKQHFFNVVLIIGPQKHLFK